MEIFNDTWNICYKVIYDANVAIYKIPSASFDYESIRNQFLNEANFLICWADFDLVRLF